MRPKGQRWKKAVDSPKELVHKLRVRKWHSSLPPAPSARSLRWHRAQECASEPGLKSSVREKSKHLRAQWMLLAPRPPLSRTKAVCFPPPPPSTSCALTTTDTGHKSGLNYVRHRETVQQKNPFFFPLPFFTGALYSAERRLLFCRWWLQWRTGALFTFRSGGKTPKWRSGETEEEGAHIAACTAAAVCGADRESLLGFAVYYFFFPRLKHLIASLLASEMKTGTGICT